MAEYAEALPTKNFTKINPMTDKFPVRQFHHVEFWCSDASTAAHRFSSALGIPVVAKSDLSTGNKTHQSYLLRTSDVRILFTAPYSASDSTATIPTFSHKACTQFTASHGLTVRSVAVEVEDAALAYSISVAHGARPSAPPVTLGEDGDVVIAEVELYGDVVLRYISYYNAECPFLPGFEAIVQDIDSGYGMVRLDHVTGGVLEVVPAIEYLKSFTGFHEFMEITAEDMGTPEGGTNAILVANNNTRVLLVMLEPILGTKTKSQIETYMENNGGPGVHHFAIESKNIFVTLREMKRRSGVCGFEFLAAPPSTYYRDVKKRVGSILSDEEIECCEEFGVMVDGDRHGTLLQCFTKPVGDRPTIFIEVIQKIGPMFENDGGIVFKGGEKGFGKGNVVGLLESLQKYEKTLKQEPI